MLRHAVRHFSRLLYNQTPESWSRSAVQPLIQGLTHSKPSVVEFSSTGTVPRGRVGVRWTAGWRPAENSIQNISSVAAWRDDQSQHGSCVIVPSSIASSSVLQCDRSHEPNFLQMSSRDSDDDSAESSPSESAPTARETVNSEKDKSLVRTVKWTRLPPAPPLVDFRGVQERAYSASKWIKRCRPDLTHGLTQKLFRKRQVRMVLSEASHVPTSDMEIDISEEFNPEDPPLSKMRRVADSDSVPPGAVLYLPAYFSLAPPRAAPGSKEKEKRKVRVSAKDADWLRQHVLYRDAHVIVLNKPPGLAVQGGTGVGRSVDSMMGEALLFDSQEGPRLVHRLDKETSGALLLGRSAESTRALHAAFREHRIEKRYWALVAGTPEPPEGRVTAPLLKVVLDGGKSDRILVATDSEGTQAAITDYRTVASTPEGFSWLELQPVSGRKHQLRVHCASVLKCPIVGDYKYGSWARDKWKVGNATEAPNQDDDKQFLEDMGTEGVGREATPSLFEKPHVQIRQDVLEQTDSVPKGGKIKGSLASLEPQLHLHCRKMVFPNMEVDVEDGEESRFDGESKSKSLRSVEAPLALHMAASWKLLGFNTQGE